MSSLSKIEKILSMLSLIKLDSSLEDCLMKSLTDPLSDYIYVRVITDALIQCYEDNVLISEVGVLWSVRCN